VPSLFKREICYSPGDVITFEGQIAIVCGKWSAHYRTERAELALLCCSRPPYIKQKISYAESDSGASCLLIAAGA